MRASLSWLNSLIVISILFGVFFTGLVDSKAQAPSSNHKLTKGLSEKVKSVPPGEKVKVIITLKKPPEQFRAQSARKSVKKDILKGGGKVKREYSIFEGMAAEIPASKVAALADNPNIEIIEYDHPVRAHLTESVPLIKADDVWNKIQAGLNITGKGQTVCVIDSGVDYNHPDLGGGKGAGYKVLGGYDFVNDNNDPIDDNWHGTHVAGIIAANGTLKGVAPDASIIAIKSLGASGIGLTSDIIAGIDWCVNNASTYNITVISMSLGSLVQYSSYCDNEAQESSFRESIDAAVAENITVVASTGNDANYTAISSPACIQNATRVGATYDSNIGGKTWCINYHCTSTCEDSSTAADQITCFTNRGPNFSDMLLAPGAQINSTDLSSGYSEKGGTSMAAPHVSGLIALLNQEYKSIYGTNPSPSYLFDVMNSTGVSIYDNKTGKNYSRIDALAAYNAIYPFSAIYSDDLDDDGDEWDNNFTVSYNTSSNTPFWSGSANKINLTDANTGEGKLIIINDTGLLFDGNIDYELNDINAGDDYILYNGLYVVDGNAGIIQLTYAPVFDSAYSNDDGSINAGEVIVIKGGKYVVTDDETSDQNISLGSAIAKTLNATTVDPNNATVVSGTKKMLYNGSYLHFYNGSSWVDNFNATGKNYPYKATSDDVNSGEFKIYNIYVLSANSSEAKVTMVEQSQLVNITNDEEEVFNYSSIKINDADFPKLNETIFFSDNMSLVEGEYVNVPDTYYSMYFDGDKNLDILRRNSTPPAITSGPTVSSITTSSATITWTTNEVSNSTVEYGTNTSYGSAMGSSSLVTSHSMTLTGLSSSTTYHYRVISSDLIGNINTSGDYIFTTSSKGRRVSGGGGGGAAAPKITTTPGEGEVEIKINYLPANEYTTVTIPDTENMPISSLKINMNKKVYNVQMTVTTLDTRPSDISEDISGKVKDYVQINTNVKDADINNVTNGFKVPVIWIDDNNIDKATVVMSRYADGKWNVLETNKTKEDSEYVHYLAVSPGFSVFGISAQKMPEKITFPQIQTVTTTAPPTTTPPPPAVEEPKSPIREIVFAILAIVVIAGTAYYWFTKKKGVEEGEVEAPEEIQETAEEPFVEESKE